MTKKEREELNARVDRALADRSWRVVGDSSGHHRSLRCSQPLQEGKEWVADPGPYEYDRACRVAGDLNAVTEVMES